jgi:uncharacterized membrane protein (DUF485 family)
MSESKIPSNHELISQLGNFQRDFRVVKHKIKRDLRIGLGLLLIILALLASLAGFFTSWQAVRVHGRAALLHTLPLPILVFVVSLLSGILLFNYTHNHWQDRVSLYENGFVLQTGKKTINWLWESTKYFNTETTVEKFGTSIIDQKFRLIFEDVQGQSLIIPGRYAEMTSLVKQIRNTLLPHLYNKAVTRLRQGDTIHFTPELNAVLKGLMVKGDLCRWVSLNPSQISKGVLHLHRVGDNKLIYKIAIKKVRNLDLLLVLFENPPLG